MTDDVLAKVARSRDQVIKRIRRVLYVGPDGTVSPRGPVELSFADGTTLLLDSGPDGEALKADTATWVDPFKEPLTEDNRRFISKSGKWTAFDVTEEELFSRLIEQTILQVLLVTTMEGKITGVMFQSSGGRLHAQVEGDELALSVS